MQKQNNQMGDQSSYQSTNENTNSNLPSITEVLSKNNKSDLNQNQIIQEKNNRLVIVFINKATEEGNDFMTLDCIINDYENMRSQKKSQNPQKNDVIVINLFQSNISQDIQQKISKYQNITISFLGHSNKETILGRNGYNWSQFILTLLKNNKNIEHLKIATHRTCHSETQTKIIEDNLLKENICKTLQVKYNSDVLVTNIIVPNSPNMWNNNKNFSTIHTLSKNNYKLESNTDITENIYHNGKLSNTKMYNPTNKKKEKDIQQYKENLELYNEENPRYSKNFPSLHESNKF